MAVLFVDEYGARLSYSNGLIVVEKDGLQIASARLQELECVIVQENCGITSAALSALLRQGVEMAFVGWGGEYLGKIEPALGRNMLLRKRQYELASDENFCLSIAKRIVTGKIKNMRTIIMRYGRSRENLDSDLIARRLQAILLKIPSADAHSLLGCEGTATEAYFSAFPTILKQPWEFNGRNRRPPKDPVNAMLSYSYNLLAIFMERAISIAGLDPYCGFYHKEVYGRQSLVLDLMEEFRPIIADSTVFKCCNRNMLSPQEDFQERDGGVYLNEQGRQKLFKAFVMRTKENISSDSSDKPISYEQVCLAQARHMASCVKNSSAEYEPFLVK